MEDFDARGRSIAQSMYEELEKIAYSIAAKRMSQQARASAADHSRVATAAGWKKWVPFTGQHRAVDAARIRARDADRAARTKIKSERAAAYKAIETGKGNQASAMRLIENKPRKVRPPGNPSGRETLEVTEPSKQKLITTKRALTAGGIGLGAVGTGIVGKKYLDSKKQQQGYGGAY